MFMTDIDSARAESSRTESFAEPDPARPVVDVDPGTESGTYGVFVYGSMVSSTEIGALLGRPARLGRDFVAATLRGWGRSWTVCTDNTTSRTVRYYKPASNVRPPVQVLFLNLERAAAPHAAVSGVVILVEAGHLPDLDAREGNYDRVLVTHSISTERSVRRPDVVWTYVGQPNRRRRARLAISEGTARIRAEYLMSVRNAFAGQEQMLAELEASLTPPPAPVANLVRVADPSPAPTAGRVSPTS